MFGTQFCDEREICQEEAQHLNRIKRSRVGDCPVPVSHEIICRLLDSEKFVHSPGVGFLDKIKQTRLKPDCSTPIRKELLEIADLAYSEQLTKTHQSEMVSLFDKLHKEVAELKCVVQGVIDPKVQTQGSISMQIQKHISKQDVIFKTREQFQLFNTFYNLARQMLVSCQKFQLSNSRIKNKDSVRLLNDNVRAIKNMKELLKSCCNYEVPIRAKDNVPELEFLIARVENDTSRINYPSFWDRTTESNWNDVVCFLQNMVVDMKKKLDYCLNQRHDDSKKETMQMQNQNPKKRGLKHDFDSYNPSQSNPRSQKLKVRRQLFQFTPLNYDPMDTYMDSLDWDKTESMDTSECLSGGGMDTSE